MTTNRPVPGLWSWAVIGLLVVGALVVGGRGRPGPPTEAQRVHGVTTQVRCPTCRGLSTADSDAPAAEAIRDEVRRRVHEGETDKRILDYLESRYGAEIRLAPKPRGVGAVVWVLPLVAGAAAIAGLSLAFAKRRSQPSSRLSDEDRALVDEALNR